MAQRKEEVYKFDVSAKTVKIPGHVEQKNLVLITNVDRGQIIYSQFDPSKGSARSHDHVWPGDPNFPDPDFPWSIDGTCVFTLDADLSGMADTDQLSILIDDYTTGTKFRPWDQGLDAVERMRVSNPESQIDTDFELGSQDTKWESIGYNRNHATFYKYGGAPLDINTATTNAAVGGSTISVTLNGTNGPLAGEPVVIENSLFENADGIYICTTGTDRQSFTYIASGTVGTTNGETIVGDVIQARRGDEYTGSRLPVISSMTGDGNGSGTTPGLVTVVFLQPHGILPGSPITIADNTTPAAKEVHEGNFFVKQVIDEVTLTYETVPNTSAVTNGSITVTNCIAYARNDSIVKSRPYDGGIQITTKEPVYGLKAVRQTKDYFKYQSGKGVWWSTAHTFMPSVEIENVNYNGTDVIFTTREQHGLAPGAKVFLEGISSANYYGEYTVKAITDASGNPSTKDFRCDPLATPPSTGDGVLDINPRITVTRWCGASIRAGLFDDQNGMFWEYDGHKVYVVKRFSTGRLAGNVSFSNHTVTGTGTKFTQQLITGQYIVIKGATYQVTGIESDTKLYTACGNRRGSTITNADVTAVRELRIPQEDWNYDTCDGKGPSGYLLRPRYIQMVGINYSWYGAGFIDFMIRGPLGQWIKVHRMPNHNINSGAYLRTGNLPGRYEVNNESIYTQLDGALLATETTEIPIKDVTRLPNPLSGYPAFVTICGRDTNDSNKIKFEQVSFTGITRDSDTTPGASTGKITGITRRASFTKTLNGVLYNDTGGTYSSFSGTTSNIDFEDGAGVIDTFTTFAPRLSHWGCSVIADGGVEKLKSFVFSYKVEATVTQGTSKNVLAFRLCPAVSDSQPQAFGIREIINRQLLNLKSVEVTNVDGVECEITGLLNPRNLGSVSYARSGGQTIGGAVTFQETFTEIATSGGILGSTTVPTNSDLLFTFFNKGVGTTTYNLSDLKPLENSVQGGNNTYPDGPEVLLLYVTNIDTTTDGNFDIVLRWEEAGA